MLLPPRRLSLTPRAPLTPHEPHTTSPAPPLRTPAIRFQTFGGPRFLWVIVTVAIATPIAFLKDMDSLRHTSFAAVAILLYIVARSRPHPPSRERQQLGRRENSGERRERRRSSSSMRRSTRATATRPGRLHHDSSSQPRFCVSISAVC